ncbi:MULTISPECIES: hypothetical protein [Lysinibacillus]|jgi:hypothetical protein|uniref:Uncharacterized protein n=2 Tax=Lysinibacillus sphaericus TaxID=1421 RepID=W7RKC9_LYSSH|nr:MULTISPECIES: hypothetical protein [Lysinibacillus]ACA38114.1 hypothetical protein Bsph_0489 [Lysinibacillus sphaericus C3-41]EWH30674.1 hypothetical protein P799_24400 [Lysinibacillus sphaericus CBAM5]EWH30989.1 hypothetical protein P799_21760 [Lysinibacillus sphaericus CBAM5]MBE5084379.1 hypothetical protein [Bacillus thuringiensis]
MEKLKTPIYLYGLKYMNYDFYDKNGNQLATFESENGLDQFLNVDYEINFEE